MLKEKIATNSRQPLRVSIQEGSHVSSTKKNFVPEVSESNTRDKVKRKIAEVLRNNVPHARHDAIKQIPRPIVYDRLEDRVTPQGESQPSNWTEKDLRKLIYLAIAEKKVPDARSIIKLARKTLGEERVSHFT